MAEPREAIRLLMVDDEEEFLDATAAALRRRGFEVRTTPSGEEALLLAAAEPPDVVLLDVKMPGLDGTEVFRRLQDRHPGLPTVLLTGHGSVGQAFDMAKEGVFDYIAKPCGLDELAEKLRRACLAGRRGGATARPGAEDAAHRVEVLLVDDETELLESLKPVLERRGMRVRTADGGEKALAMLATDPVEVVVLDVKMPGLDGVEVLKRIKAERPAVEVVLLTGHPTVDTAMRGVKEGAFDYVVKPPEIEKLAAVVRAAQARRREVLDQDRQQTVERIIRRFAD